MPSDVALPEQDYRCRGHTDFGWAGENSHVSLHLLSYEQVLYCYAAKDFQMKQICILAK